MAWDDEVWEYSEEYAGQRFGKEGWGPTSPIIDEFYAEADPNRKRKIGKQIVKRMENGSMTLNTKYDENYN